MSCLVAQSHHSRQIWKCLFRTLVIEGAVKVSGGHTGGATPDPIPNSEVKTSRAHGTAGETLWESRSPPGLFRRSPRALNKLGGFFLLWDSEPADGFRTSPAGAPDCELAAG